MEGIALLLMPLILIVGLFYLGKLGIKVFTGKPAGQWAGEREAKKWDHQMEMVALQHRQQVQAADRYIQKNGTGWINGR